MSRRDNVLGWTRPTVRDMKPYYKAPLEGDPLRLDQNTNLWGANPALAAVQPPAADQYPSRDSDALLAALADWHGLHLENFVIGNGSDELLDLLTKAFTESGQTFAIPSPSYSLYPFYAKLQGLKTVKVPLRGGFRLDVDGILDAKPSLVIVPSPNNPTGNRFDSEDLERLIQGVDGIVVIDEAYIEYAGLKHSLLPRVEEFDNLVVLRTFSKAYGLAGLRIGYMAANVELAQSLRLVKPPFNLNVYSEAVAVRALEEQEWVDGVVRGTQQERERLQSALKAMGFRVHPSDANFVLCEHPMDPSEMHLALRGKDILVRTFQDDVLAGFIRFGVGKPEHTDALLAALQEVLA